MLRIDVLTGLVFISFEHVFVLTKTTNRVTGTEAPGIGAHPAKIPHRVTDMGNLPVKHSYNTVRGQHEITVSEIVVNQCGLMLLRQIFH